MENIRNLIKAPKEERRQISVLIHETDIERMAIIADEVSKLAGKKISRNKLIEQGIDEYLQAASEVLLKDHGIDVNKIINKKEG